MTITMTDYVSPTVQAMNLIRYIGDEVKKTGQPINQLPAVGNIIGAQSDLLAQELLKELMEKNLVRVGEEYRKNINVGGGYAFIDVTLSLAGWERYEAEQRGVFAGNYGFLAMQFDESEHEAFVREILKPAVKKGIGYDLHDQRDKSKAGIIDNILRVNIRDAQFVIVDLTYDNRGAYWEAGYAEGLGKPVVYICEKEKFEAASTHFDTNHLTTVLWSYGNEEEFSQELVATLRRSLEPEGRHQQRDV